MRKQNLRKGIAMKRSVISIMLCVLVINLMAKVDSFDSYSTYICSQCGLRLTNQEMALSQIVCADKEVVLYMCDACRVHNNKGKEQEARKALVAAKMLYDDMVYPEIVVYKEDDLRTKVLKKNTLAALAKKQAEEDRVLESLAMSLFLPVPKVTSGSWTLSLLSDNRLLLEGEKELLEIYTPDRTCSTKTGEPVSYFVITRADGMGNGKFLLFSNQSRSKDVPDNETKQTIFELDAEKKVFTLVKKPQVDCIENGSNIAITVEEHD